MQAIQLNSNADKNSRSEIFADHDKLIWSGQEVEEERGMQTFEKIIDGSETGFHDSWQKNQITILPDVIVTFAESYVLSECMKTVRA
jgi:hypothetical protein